MKQVYIAYIKQDKEDYLVYVPDIDQFTSGKTLFEAFHMGRDLLGAWFLEGKSIPEPSGHAMALLKTRKKADEEDFRFSEGEAVYIDNNFDEYRRKLNTTAVVPGQGSDLSEGQPSARDKSAGVMEKGFPARKEMAP